ncbi:hypothetical protein [Corallococcus sp. CA053C]|uniref:hypothetical protein n=1 Tax=Corallococcus sp. CA053C TaxID=2316732 RepID=UPI0011C3A96B|nr:hypothetical protein [Corallococcus sp. CA053C]
MLVVHLRRRVHQPLELVRLVELHSGGRHLQQLNSGRHLLDDAPFDRGEEVGARRVDVKYSITAFDRQEQAEALAGCERTSR